MVKLRDLDIKMKVFLSSVGAMTLRLDKKVTADLAANKAESISESVNQDESFGFSSQDSQDSQDESIGFSSQDSQDESQELDISLDLEIEKIQNESMESSEDNSSSIVEDSFDASALWQKRKAKEASNVKENLEPKGKKRKNVVNDPYSDDEEITMDEGWRLAHIILKENNMELSPTQRDTPGKKYLVYLTKLKRI